MADNVRKRIMSGMVWSLLEKFSTQGVSFIVGVVLARLLMPEQYGVIAMTSVFMMICGLFIDSGFGVALIQKKDADDLDYNTVMYSSTTIGVVLYILMFFVAPFVAVFFNTPQLCIVLRVVTLSFLWSGYYSVLSSWISKRMLFRTFFYRTLIANITSGIVGITMAYMGCGVWALIGQNFTAAAVGMVTLQYSVEWHPSFQYSWTRAKRLLAFGSNILGANLIGGMFHELKGLLIGKWYSPADLALYNKGQGLPGMVVNNVSGSLGMVLFPAMSQYADDREKVKQLTRRSMRLSSYIMSFCMVTLIIVSEPLVRFLFTDKWIACVPFMQLVCLEKLADIIGNANLQAMKAVGEGNVIMKLEIYKKPVFLLMTVIGAYISVYALAVTLPLYSMYSDVINAWSNKRVLNYSFSDQLRDLLPAYLLGFVTFIIVSPLKNLIDNDLLTVFTECVVSAFVYFGLSILLKNESFSYLKGIIIELKNKKKNGQ